MKEDLALLVEAGLYNPEALINDFGPGSVDAKLADMIAPGGYERWIKKVEGLKFEPKSELDKMREILGIKNREDK